MNANSVEWSAKLMVQIKLMRRLGRLRSACCLALLLAGTCPPASAKFMVFYGDGRDARICTTWKRLKMVVLALHLMNLPIHQVVASDDEPPWQMPDDDLAHFLGSGLTYNLVPPQGAWALSMRRQLFLGRLRAGSLVTGTPFDTLMGQMSARSPEVVRSLLEQRPPPGYQPAAGPWSVEEEAKEAACEKAGPEDEEEEDEEPPQPALAAQAALAGADAGAAGVGAAAAVAAVAVPATPVLPVMMAAASGGGMPVVVPPRLPASPGLRVAMGGAGGPDPADEKKLAPARPAAPLGPIPPLVRTGLRAEPNMRVREVIDLLLEDGWFLHKTTGGHRQFKHKKKGGKVTVPGGMGESLPLKTLKSIFTQAQWR